MTPSEEKQLDEIIKVVYSNCDGLMAIDLDNKLQAFINSVIIPSVRHETARALTLEKKGVAFMRDEALMYGGYNQAVDDLEAMKAKYLKEGEERT